MPASRLRVRCSMGNEVSVPQSGCSPQSWDRYVLRSTYSMLYNALQFRSSAGWLHRGRPTGPFPGTVDTATTPVRAGVTTAPVPVLACTTGERGLDGGQTMQGPVRTITRERAPWSIKAVNQHRYMCR